MLVLHPDPFLLPAYRISPFSTEFVAKNHLLPEGDATAYLNERFGAGHWQITRTGREALQLALDAFNLKQSDTVTIYTSSNNFYISSCVTNEIARCCQWNRDHEATTRAFLMNHEFGYPDPKLAAVAAGNVPLIEDCCTTFFTHTQSDQLGKTGDFSIYSFPKFFPMQLGGLLVTNTQRFVSGHSLITAAEYRYVMQSLAYGMAHSAQWLKQRAWVWEALKHQFGAMGFVPRFPETAGVVPSVFLFRSADANRKIDYPALKELYVRHGVQCSVFYGEEAFFLPAHQFLSETDVQYFAAIMKSFLNQSV